MPAASDHGQVDTKLPRFAQADDDVDILALATRDVLFFLNLMQGLNLVAVNGRLLKGQALRSSLHRIVEALCNFLLAPEQKHRRQLDICSVIVRRDVPDARPAASLDLVQQAGPRAVGEHGVFTGTQTEHLLQQVNAVAYRPRRWIGAEIVGFAVRIAAKES